MPLPKKNVAYVKAISYALHGSTKAPLKKARRHKITLAIKPNPSTRLRTCPVMLGLFPAQPKYLLSEWLLKRSQRRHTQLWLFVEYYILICCHSGFYSNLDCMLTRRVRVYNMIVPDKRILPWKKERKKNGTALVSINFG